MSVHEAGYFVARPDSHINTYGTKSVSFRFRGRSYNFALSHGLFSSADIDTGSRFLLKVFSDALDEDIKNGKPLPHRILDAGSGVGVLGICAAGAIRAAETPESLLVKEAEKSSLHVRAQDRDELARIFTEYNARQNSLGPETLGAWTEPLLAGPGGWDLILSNIPAKAGLPVLEDFVRRSAALLNAEGRVFLVAVNTLSDFFDSAIQANSSLIIREKGPGHTVFMYARKERKSETSFPFLTKDDFFIQCPGYIRRRNEYEIEKTSYHLDTIHGAPGFDSPGDEILVAAKLVVRLKEEILSCFRSENKKNEAVKAESPESPVLIWEGSQGHFSSWFAAHFRSAWGIILAERNILSLVLSRYNTAIALKDLKTKSSVQIVCAADLYLDREKILGEAEKAIPGTGSRGFPFIAAFPEFIPQVDIIESLWEGFAALASPQGIVLTGFSSAEAERFDRKKPKDFSRLGDLRKKGFRALAYKKTL